MLNIALLHPVNLFVAGFIGSPSMNFLEAVVSDVNGTGTLYGYDANNGDYVSGGERKWMVCIVL